MTKTENIEFQDGFGDFTAGINSGIKPILLPKNQLSYATNATVRGRCVTHRPPYQLQSLILEPSIDLTGLLFQGATYYKPDFGSESIVAQIGGRLFQFVPDAVKTTYVYDHTVRNYFGGSSSTTRKPTGGLVFSFTANNISDSTGSNYDVGTPITSYPSFVTTMTNSATVNAVFYGSSEFDSGSAVNIYRYNFTAVLPAGFTLTPGLYIGKQVYINTTSASGQIKWDIIGQDTSGPSPTLQLQYTTPQNASGATITFPAGSPIYYTSNPVTPQILGAIAAPLTAPALGSPVTVFSELAFQRPDRFSLHCRKRYLSSDWC